MAEQPEVLTPSEAAELLRISERSLRRLVARRRIPHVRMGRAVRFSRETLLEWVRGESARQVQDREVLPKAMPNASPRARR